MVAKCEELLERVTTTLSIMTGQHPLISIDPQRVTHCTACRAILPSAGEYWSSGSIAVADRVMQQKRASHLEAPRICLLRSHILLSFEQQITRCAGDCQELNVVKPATKDIRAWHGAADVKDATSTRDSQSAMRWPGRVLTCRVQNIRRALVYHSFLDMPVANSRVTVLKQAA